MKLLKTILILLAGIIAVLLVIALFIKKEFALEKTVMIQKPKEEVFNYLRRLRNQEHYSVWVMKDPEIKINYTGTDGTVGAISAWTSDDKNVGVGEQEIIELKEGDYMKVEIRFKKPFEGTNYATTSVTTIDGGHTKVSTVFTGKSNYPMNLMNLLMDKMVGADMQKNLDNMKANLEKK